MYLSDLNKNICPVSHENTQKDQVYGFIVFLKSWVCSCLNCLEKILDCYSNKRGAMKSFLSVTLPP